MGSNKIWKITVRGNNHGNELLKPTRNTPYMVSKETNAKLALLRSRY